MNTTQASPKRGAHRGRGHAVLPRPGLGDDAALAHAAREQHLPDRVVDLVRAGVVEVLALEPHRRAHQRGEPRRAVSCVGRPTYSLAGRSHSATNASIAQRRLDSTSSASSAGMSVSGRSGRRTARTGRSWAERRRRAPRPRGRTSKASSDRSSRRASPRDRGAPPRRRRPCARGPSRRAPTLHARRHVDHRRRERAAARATFSGVSPPASTRGHGPRPAPDGGVGERVPSRASCPVRAGARHRRVDRGAPHRPSRTARRVRGGAWRPRTRSTPPHGAPRPAAHRLDAGRVRIPRAAAPRRAWAASAIRTISCERLRAHHADGRVAPGTTRSATRAA
jgi:hypothetical protein